MTTTTAQDESIEHTAVGKLIEQIDKAMKRNPAMPVGEFWRWHLKALLTEMHQFHIDYTDDAADEAGGVNPAYVDDLLELVNDGRGLVFALTTLLMKTCKQVGYLDAQDAPDASKMPKDILDLLTDVQGKAREWLAQYGELVEEPAPEAASNDAGGA